MRNPYFKLILLILIIGVVGFYTIRYIASLPTPEEKVVIKAMKDFQRGRYEEVSGLCINGSFFKVLENSKVYDTDGTEIIWRQHVNLWSEAILQFSIETYVKPHLRRFEFKSLSTQRLDKGASAVVHFLIEFTVHDYTGGGGYLAPDVYNGSVEGDCFLKRDPNGNMVIERFDLTLMSSEGMDLKRYLHLI